MDRNYSSHTGVIGNLNLGDLVPPDDGVGWADTLKFSAADGGDVQAGLIVGGKEDCIDINNGCRNLAVRADCLRSGGAYVATIKGGAKNITISGLITKHGSAVDIDADNFSDQGHAPSENIRLNLTTVDGSPVTWRSWMGTRPVIMNPDQPYRCVFCIPRPIGKVINRAYWALKRIGLAK